MFLDVFGVTKYVKTGRIRYIQTNPYENEA